MNPEIGFFSSLAVTVVLLAGVVVTGKTRRLAVHVRFVAAALLGLVASVYFAIKMGELFDLEKAGVITPIHSGLAKVTSVASLWPPVTGPMAVRGKASLRIHRTGAWFALFMTVVATDTGLMMLYGAERLV